MLPNLKLSYYNHFIPHKERGIYIIYNSFTNSMIEIDFELGHTISKLNSMEVHYLDIDVIDILKDNGMIVSSNIDEFVEMKNRANHSRRELTDSSTFFLCISPTNSCNMKCPYCFQGDKSAKLRDSKYLDSENIENLKNLLHKAVYSPHSTPITKVLVEWFGGEPLLRKNSIREFSEYAIELCKQNNIEYSASIITNAALLDEKTWDLLYDCKVEKVQVTIDGEKDKHNQVRFYANGKGSYEDIMNNLKIMPKDKFKLVLRINGDRLVFQDIPKLFEDLENREIWPQRNSEISFHWAPKFFNFLGDNQQKDIYFTSYDYQKSRQDFEYIRVNHYNNWAKQNGKIDKKLHFAYPSLANFYCVTVESRNSLSIDDGGYIHKCYNTVNSKNKRIEHISDFDGTNPNLDSYKKFDKTVQADCRTCKVLPICEEDCNMRFISNAESKICTAWKYFMDERMKAIYDQSFANSLESEIS
ncbi:radical SAM/SPASM domain-containing protein [Sphingobacterium sp. UBA6320]|jgi:uncharacterized protein|uniref:radical SAM/SPASM domain-containing protein n=1 Tax=Sphingobacterium sp. UBA6320 TaxID=1947510 RepID=UPI0025EA6135|nr:radical SAM protein [Sphingobacterium sp. UBA6320]